MDEKERADYTWTAVRRSFAPAFGMLAQVLKKKKLKDEGSAPFQGPRKGPESNLDPSRVLERVRP